MYIMCHIKYMRQPITDFFKWKICAQTFRCGKMIFKRIYVVNIIFVGKHFVLVVRNVEVFFFCYRTLVTIYITNRYFHAIKYLSFIIFIVREFQLIIVFFSFLVRTKPTSAKIKINLFAVRYCSIYLNF